MVVLSPTADSDDAIATLLSSGGDSRLVLSDVRNANKYGCRFEPETGLLPLGSCTGSTVSAPAFETVRRAIATLPGDDEGLVVWGEETFETIRHRLASHFFRDAPDGAEIVLSPSGTDAEFIPLVLAGAGPDRTLRSIVVAPYEVGSGTTAAATGEHFDELRPHLGDDSSISPFPAGSVELRTVAIRAPDGEVRELDDIDDEVVRLAEEGLSLHDHVVVHVVAHSKTGVHAPSLETIDRLERAHGDRLTVVVDAAQGRISRRGLGEALASGRVVLLTGSKFYGGPPFSGAVLLPPGALEQLRVADEVGHRLRAYFRACEAPRAATQWRSTLDDGPNIGLALRWLAALTEIDAYYDTPPERRFAVLRAFQQIAPELLDAQPAIAVEASPPGPADDDQPRLLESKRTVFSFSMSAPDGIRLGSDALRLVQAEIRSGRSVVDNSVDITAVETGQPVLIGEGGLAVLRVALGAPLMRRWAGPGDVHERIAADLAVAARSLQAAVDRVASDITDTDGPR